MKNKGFTLVELLAVIVILAVIALILVPVITGIIETARINVFKDNVMLAATQIDYYLYDQNLDIIPSDGVNVTDLNIISNFTGGKFIKDADGDIVSNFVRDSNYCAYGKIKDLRVAKDCRELDLTPPIVSELGLKLTSTTKSIDVYLLPGLASDIESGIKSYTLNLYKGDNHIDSKTVSSEGVVVFDGLSNSTLYKVKLTVTNGNNINTNLDKEISTLDIDSPTYQISTSGWAQSKDVIISYPDGFTNEYSLDSGNTWNNYNGMITFKDNGTVIARVTDGYNYVTSSSLTVTGIDINQPVINISSVGVTTSFTLSDIESLDGYNVTTSYPTEWISISGTSVNLSYTASISGTYYIYVRDSSGRISVLDYTLSSSSFCSYNPGQVWNYDYNGGIQSFVTPCKGIYRLQAWGAQGGGAKAGTGGYSIGYATINSGTTLYIVVGGAGSYVTVRPGNNGIVGGGFNGGGNGMVSVKSTTGTNLDATSGGGATHIGTRYGTLQQYGSLAGLYIVAGAGGGGNGSSGTNTSGGTQTGPGSSWGENGAKLAGGGFGYGGYTTGQNGNETPSAGGGGGLYGGGAAAANYYNFGNNCPGAGGGSGYIGGVPSFSYNGTYYESSSTSGGKIGNGYATITYMELVY